MFSLRTIPIFLFRLYCGYFIAVVLLLTGILVISNIFDILQKFKTIYIPAGIFWKLALYKIPYSLNEVASLISCVAMLFFLRRLTKYNELMTILSSGVHIWNVLIIPVFSTLILGGIIIATINTIGTVGLQKYELLQAKLHQKKPNDLIVSGYGLLFSEKYDNKNRIVEAESINIVEKKLNNVILLFTDKDNYLIKRIDAKYAILDGNELKLFKAKIYTDNNLEVLEDLTIPTNLSIDNLVRSFVPPEMISIWDLPYAIKQLAQSGLPIINYQLYYYKQLFKPLIMLTSVILASCFISLKNRDNSQEKMLVAGLFLGVVAYSLLEILLKILVYNNITPALAVLLPNILILFISNFVILHTHA